MRSRNISCTYGRPYRLSQILINLLGNSIKFTEHGSVTISCAVGEDSDTYQRLDFRITDTGIGISEDFIAHLFDKFTQEDESISRKFGGTGLGMSISKELIEQMGGAIHVESKKGAGTVMSFSIRLQKGAESDLPEEVTTEADTQTLKGKRILLVEDNVTNRLLANNILSQYGAEVTEAEDGSVAIEKMSTFIFDLVLMDMQMPVMNGLEATKYIREHIDKSIPIVALTASAYKKEQEKCLEAGMNDFISKPLDEDKMIRQVAEWLGRGTAVPIKKETKNNASSGKAKNIPDLSIIYSFAADNMDFVKGLAQTFIEDLSENINKMETARESGNWKDISAIAHKVRPSVASFKMDAILPHLEDLENMDPLHPDSVMVEQHIAFIKETSISYGKDLMDFLNSSN